MTAVSLAASPTLGIPSKINQILTSPAVPRSSRALRAGEPDAARVTQLSAALFSVALVSVAFGEAMTASAKQASKRQLLLASDRSDQSSELASILEAVGEVSTVSTQDIPEQPGRDLSGVVVDINLRSSESVQRVRNKLRGDAYRAMPRLFVLADALHHGTMQAWALCATDTISRPLQPDAIP